MRIKKKELDYLELESFVDHMNGVFGLDTLVFTDEDFVVNKEIMNEMVMYMNRTLEMWRFEHNIDMDRIYQLKGEDFVKLLGVSNDEGVKV